MEPQTRLDADLFAAICNKHPADQAAELQQAQARHGCDTVYRSLIDLVRSQALPPTVFHVFLATCKDPAPLVHALRQPDSALTRKLAIRHVGKRARADADFLPLWDCLGATSGCMATMATLSVDEVERLCQVIGDASTTQRPSQGRQRCITQLLEALTRTAVEDETTPPNPDPRPLASCYRLLLPACSSQAVVQQTTRSNRPSRRTVQAHAGAFQGHVLEQVFPDAGGGVKITPHRHVLDQSLEFAMDVLRRLEQSPPDLRTNREVFMKDVAYPLARRLARRRDSDALQIAFYNLFLSCARQESAIASQIHKGFVSKAVSAWKRARTPEAASALEHALGTLIGLIKDKKQCSMDVIQFQMSGVNPAKRFRLLQLYLKHATGYGADFTLSSETMGANYKSLDIKWPLKVLLLLPSGISVKLFNTLRAIHTDGKFLAESDQNGFRGYRLEPSRSTGEELANPDSVSALLHARDCQPESSWLDRAEYILHELKQQAAATRTAERRADLVCAAIHFSIAIGRLDKFAETLLWARRFNKDPTTTRKIYAIRSVDTVEGLGLLSGLPAPDERDASRSLDSIRSNIEEANSIILQALETASMMLHEPNFRYHDVRTILCLPGDVVECRIDRAVTTFCAKGVSDADIFETVWAPTLDMLIEAEKYGLREGREDMRLNTVYGPFNKFGAAPKCDTKPHYRRFLDCLSQRRDALWVEHRAATRPATMTLSSIWPRGLPIQLLCPAPDDVLQDMPYLESRAAKVVFATDLSGPFPYEAEVQEAIGPFVDDYRFALKVYVLSVDKGGERDERILGAWKHALAKLTLVKLSTKEAELYWLSVFDTLPALPPQIASLRLSRRPAFPPDVDANIPSEWNPDPDAALLDKLETTRLREITRFRESVLDCLLLQRNLNVFANASLPFVIPPRQKWASNVPSIWYQKAPLKLPATTRDALATAAMLYINTRHGSDASLLRSPFPSPDCLRIPALFIDEEFVEKESKHSEMSVVLLLIAELSASVPVHLLAQLSHSLLNKTKATKGEDSKLHEAAMGVLLRLTRSDTPESAYPAIQDLVLNNQDDSSWHRHFVNKRYLRRLRAEQAQSFLNGLFRAVIDRIRDQDSLRKAQGEADKAKEPSIPFIKISTIKMIAQILRDAKYISHDCACSLLEDLVVSSSHHDIQIAVLEGLLTMRSGTDDHGLRTRILDILVTHIVPRAASVDERNPISSQDWLDAQTTTEKTLPLMYEGESLDEMPPMMKLLHDESSKRHIKEDPRELALWMERVIVPLMQQSAANHKQWTRMFLRQNGLSTRAAECLPLVPTRLNLLLDNFTSFAPCLPSTTFDEIEKLQWMLLAPPTIIKEVTAAIQADGELQQSNGARRWLHTWQVAASNVVWDYGFKASAVVLCSPGFDLEADGAAGATRRRLQQFLLELGRHVVTTSQTQNFRYLVEGTYWDLPEKPEVHELWLNNALPVLEELLGTIAELRTEAWQRDPHRSPEVLPNLFSRRLDLFKMKHDCSYHDGKLPRGVDAFVEAIDVIIEDVISKDQPYHTLWDDLEGAVTAKLDDSLGVTVATRLGHLPPSVDPRKLPLAAQLRIELAEHVLIFATRPGEEELLKLKVMLEDWSSSPSEHIREKGRRVYEQLTSKSGGRHRFRL